MQPRLLALIPPGRQARHYVVGLVQAARRMDVSVLPIELAAVWQALAAGPQALPVVQREVAAIVRRHRSTHALGYGYAGAEFGVVPSSPGAVEPLLPALGLTHFMLWTDHPEWLNNGLVLQPGARRMLAHPRHIHFVKSHAAAEEVRAVLGWPNVHALAMAEDSVAYTPAPGVQPVHDAVAIVGDCRPLAGPASENLNNDDPDPTRIDERMAEDAATRFVARLATEDESARFGAGLRALAEDWLAAKRAQPLRTLHELAANLPAAQQDVIAWLKADPVRWYGAIGALRTMSAWRRDFNLAWLARRADLGLYGADARCLDIAQEPAARNWVEYASQPAVYALGAAAINTNAAHDEAGCTHKPFQITMAGAPCVHAATAELDHQFRSPEEMLTFSRPAELLDHVKRLKSDPQLRSAVAEAGFARARKDHTWEQRLAQMLSGSAPSGETGSIIEAKHTPTAA